ncbi:hypothetical protein [Nocardia asiatica]|uniref:hypothetical protein n=1 Tax=Nocardia asiatica TaxID=209252 RepID=UPI0012FB4E20|nr:hypothetical protein [Nocardia asiatica]
MRANHHRPAWLLRLGPLISATCGVVAATSVASCSAQSEEHPSGTAPSTTVVNTTAAPSQLRWDTYRGVRLPRSRIDGPTHSGVVDTGYKQTPQGAALAAIRGQAYLALADDDEWGKVVSIVTAPGPGRDAFAAQRAPLTVSGVVPADQAPRFVAFKIDHYSSSEPITAAARVVTETGSPSRTFAYPVALQWLADDWRIVLPTAEETIDAVELTSLDGYTRLES